MYISLENQYNISLFSESNKNNFYNLFNNSREKKRTNNTLTLIVFNHKYKTLNTN